MDIIQKTLSNTMDNTAKMVLAEFTSQEKNEAINKLSERRFIKYKQDDNIEDYIRNTHIDFNKKYRLMCSRYGGGLDGSWYTNIVSAALYESIAQKWVKTKQSYNFDGYFIDEMCKTTSGITLPHNVFDKLPFQIMYLDISQNPKSGENGVLADVRKVAEHSDGTIYWLLTFLALDFYNAEVASSISLIIEDPVEGKELDFDKLENKSVNEALYVQLLIYLCSYTPDIRDDATTKMQYKKAKQSRKKGVKVDLPIQKHSVGERFGQAFRKWTVAQHAGDNNDNHTEFNGTHVRPHIRRAHWHRYWIGSKGNKELTIKWVHECYCGTTEDSAKDNIDIVKHRVKK